MYFFTNEYLTFREFNLRGKVIQIEFMLSGAKQLFVPQEMFYSFVKHSRTRKVRFKIFLQVFNLTKGC